MRIYRLVLAAALVAVVAGCGSDDGKTEAAQATPAVTTAAASPSPTVAPADPKAILDALAAKGLPITQVAVQDENSDPNNLLGRPNGYTARASGNMPGGDTSGEPGGIDRGIVVEVWPDTAAADARSKYIQDALKTGGAMLGTEYHYRAAGGRALVRVTGKVKPSVAGQVEAAVKAL